MQNASTWLRPWPWMLLAGCLFATPLLRGQEGEAPEWNYWRGPTFNGTSTETGLPDEWNPRGGQGSNLAWKREDLGGRSTPVVMNGRLYTILRAEPGTPREGERVVCLDAASGETVWENRFNVWLSDVPDTRVGWSSVVADPDSGNVYALGVGGYFLCIDGETGETVWSMPLHEQLGLLTTYGGRTNFPIVHEDLVIISGVMINWGDYARPNHRLVGFDKLSGEVRWLNGTQDLPDDTTYSAPSLVTIEGQVHLIMGIGDGAVWGFQPRTGRPLWKYQLSRRGLFATPLVDGHRVYAGHSEENVIGSSMGAVAGLEITGTGSDVEVRELWKIEELVAGRSTPLLIDDRLYVLDDRCKLWILDPESGEPIAERLTIGDRRQWSSMLHADGKLYIFTENGRWAIVRPEEDGIEFLDRGSLRGEEFLASPIAHAGRIYVNSTAALYCLADPEKEHGWSEPPPREPEASVDEHPEPAWVQVVPGEVTLRPGESAKLTARVFNDLGQFLEEASSVEYSVQGAGSVEEGVFQTDADARHRVAIVTAKVGDLTGQARIRVIPDLPWSFDFEQADDAPVTWIGARYRHVIRTLDGSPVLVKVTTIPKGTRSRSFMGHSDLSEYTIQAEVRGQRNLDQLPDIGVIAQGYALVLQGNSQKLEIRSWDPQLRMAVDVDFDWEPDVWYQMKLRADLEEQEGHDGQPRQVAVLRGKVWPRGSEEPKEWTVTARDESPNLTGSPGLFGKADVAELYYDRVEVFPNEDQP